MFRRRPASASEIQPRIAQRAVAALLRRRMGGRRYRAIRRIVAVGLLAVAGALAAVPQSEQIGTPVWVAAHDLAVGAVLTTADLRRATVAAPPDGALLATARSVLTGRALASAVRRGETLTDVRLLDEQGPDPGPGRVALPVAIEPAIAGLLRPGMRVTLVGIISDTADDSHPSAVTTAPLAREAIVLVAATEPNGPQGRDRTNTVLVSVPSDSAAAVTAAAVTDSLVVQFGS